MINREAIRRRYLQDPFPKRVAALAANLGRISSFSQRGKNVDLLKSLIQESECFIEWTASDAPSDFQGHLVMLQIQLALWLLQMEKNKLELESLAIPTQAWSQELLEKAGFLDSNESN